MSTRFVLVDDSDARIEYSGGPWFLGQNQDLGIYGPAWNNTLHGVNSNANLSFTFNGSSVLLYGTIAQDNSNGVVPTWNCFLDGVGINSNVSQAGDTPIPTNNWKLCANDVAADDGSHTVTLQTTVIAGNQTFWFDYIKYAPVLDASWENENIYVDDKDSEIRYVGIWDSTSGHSGVEHATNETGANVGFSFIGTSITWYGVIIPPARTHALSTYSIDGQNLTSFEPLGGTNFAYHQVLFQATSLPMGLHNLQVVYNGTAEDTPLSIDFLVVQNGSIPTTSTPPTTIVPPTPTPSPASSKAYRAALEATCATLGALIILGGLGILFLRRRRRFRLTPFPIAPVSLAVSSDLNRALADISPPSIQPLNLKSIQNGITNPPRDRTNESGVPRWGTRIPDAEPSRVLPPTYTFFWS
ncbi:hypothetical protein BJ912DRAFT_932467 [Pholiota molesta]|nr:hypothetical protein BJ912DRAFT_932467 [Pholiota molesta]